MTRKLVFYLLLSCLVCIDARASYPIVRNFSKNICNSGTQNWMITQDIYGGCMYFANNNGLLEFDGKEWATYHISNFSNVRSVLYDKESRTVFVGGFNEFGSFRTDSKGEFSYTSLLDEAGIKLGIEEIWNIIKTDEGFILQSNRDVFSYDTEGNLKKFSVGDKINASIKLNNTVIVATASQGLKMLVENMFIPLPGAEHIAGREIVSLSSVSEDKMLITTADGSIWIYEWNEHETDIKRLETGFEQELAAAKIFCCATGKDWVALGTVKNGVFIKNISDGRQIHLNRKGGLQNNTVLSLGFDITGNLWLGLDNGVSYVTIESPETSLFSFNGIYGAGYTSLRLGGTMYLGTNQGLYKTPYPFPDKITDENIKEVNGMDGQIWSLSKVGDDVFCSADKGLFVLRGNEFVKVPGTGGTWKVLNGKRKDKLVCSGYNSIYFIRKVNGSWIYDGDLKGSENISSGNVATDSSGRIWIYHWMKGTFRFTFNEENSVTGTDYFAQNYGFPDEYNNLVNIYDGNVVLSSGNGWYTIDDASGRGVPFDRLNALFDSPQKNLRFIQSPYNDLFFLSYDMNAIAFAQADGSYKVDSISLKFLHNKQLYGFEHLNFLDKDNVLISTVDGFSILDLTKIRERENDKGNDVFIKRVSITSTNSDSLIFGARESKPAELQIRYKDNSVRFEFACPYFDAGDAILYSWKLDGYDDNWSKYSASSAKEYTNLPQGEYVFYVRSENRFKSHFSETKISLKVLPPWYATSYAFFLYSIIVFFGIFLIIKLAEQRSERMIQIAKKEKDAEMESLRKASLEHDLKHKSHDLASSTMNLIRKNEILLKISEDIATAAELVSDNEEEKSVRLMNKIRKNIRENIEFDNHWQKFEANFDLVYENFLKRLSEKYKNLTVSDKKLCAYLKMGLSSKDIAPLLNISAHSVEMARYRLRKKLELGRETNLTDYLQNF